MTPAQAKRQIEAAEWEVREAENRIEDLRRPEEKYEAALAEYRAEAERYTDRTIAAQMELDEIQATLKKPWYEYADSNGVRRRKSHPIANRCAELSALLEPSWSLDYAKRELERRKDMLNNFSGYITKAERDLEAARENLRNLRELSMRVISRTLSKKPRVRKEIPDIRFTGAGSDYLLDSEDIRVAFKAGMRGLSIIAGDVFYSIKREWLRPVLGTVDAFTIRVNGCVEIRWQTGYLKFKPSDMVMAKWFDPLIDLNRGRRLKYDANDNPIWED
jgi:hypothetical protein